MQKALEMLIRDGYSSVNIKTLSKEIGCSTQPLVWHFGNMDGLREAFLQIGYSYVNMAFDEPNLFRFIYMGESKQYCRGGFNFSEMGIDLLSKLNADIDLQKTLSNITLPKGDA